MTSSVAKDARNSIFRLKVTDLLITIIEKHFPGTIDLANRSELRLFCLKVSLQGLVAP